MDTGFLIVIAVALCLLSGGIAVRLTAAGMKPRRVAMAIVELWVLVGLWMAAFHMIARSGDVAITGGMRQEVGGLLSGLRDVPGALRPWIAAGLTISVALAAHLMWSLSRGKCGGVNS
jgi:hypothetical protein